MQKEKDKTIFEIHIWKNSEKITLSEYTKIFEARLNEEEAKELCKILKIIEKCKKK